MSINSINGYGYYNQYQPRFTGTDPYLQQMIGLSTVNPNTNQSVIPATNPIKQDTVEISTKQPTEENKKGLSKGAKWAIAFGAIGATIAGVAIAHKISQRDLKKLYETKLVQSVLPEELKFTKAATKEEALKFTKETLGIKNVDENITLEALNFANKGLVDVSNANKGRLFMPKAIHFEEMEDSAVACVYKDIKSERFMNLNINSKWFDEKFLNKELKNFIIKEDNEMRFAMGTINELIPDFDSKVSKLLQKYCDDITTLNIEEKRDLLSIMFDAESKLNAIERYPLLFLTNNKAVFEKAGIQIPFEQLTKKTTKEQFELAKELFSNLDKKLNQSLVMEIEYTTPHKDLYHEMGHLQDFGKNLKKVALDSNKYALNNRWSGTTYGNMQEILDKTPETFKSCCPDLYEFLRTQDIQQTAGEVSWYAQTSIGEFVAEVYAKMVKGEKISDEVMKLYEKYGGPKLGDVL